MHNYKNIAAASVVFAGALLVLLTELNVWHLLNNVTYSSLFGYITMVAEVLALYKCVQLYRRYENPYFKMQYILLAVTVTYAIVKKLYRLLLFPDTPGVFGNFSEPHGLCFIVSLTSSLLAVYALLVYLESYDQPGKDDFWERLSGLVPAATGNKLFWPAIIGGPLLIYAVQIFGVSGISLQFISSSLQILIQSTVSLASTLLGLLLVLSLHRVYSNKLFKYLAVVYSIDIILVGLTLFNSAIYMAMAMGHPSPSMVIIDRLFIFIVLFSRLAVALIYVYAFFTYRESSFLEKAGY